MHSLISAAVTEAGASYFNSNDISSEGLVRVSGYLLLVRFVYVNSQGELPQHIKTWSLHINCIHMLTPLSIGVLYYVSCLMLSCNNACLLFSPSCKTGSIHAMYVLF